MNESTPEDLATSFRSLPRRLREATGDAEPAAVASLTAELDGHIAAAGQLVRAGADPAAIAAAITARPADDWDDATLDALRREALAAGAVLRRITKATGADEDD